MSLKEYCEKMIKFNNKKVNDEICDIHKKFNNLFNVIILPKLMIMKLINM